MNLPKQLLKSNAPELTVDWELRFSADNGPLQSLTADALTETGREESDGGVLPPRSYAIRRTDAAPPSTSENSNSW